MNPLLFLLLIIPSISFSQDSTGFDPDVRDVPLDTVRKENVRMLMSVPIIQHKFKYESPKLKQYIPSAIFFLVSGMFQGSGDASRFYHIKNDGFFDGRTSWKRKYKNGDYKQGEAFPLSTSVLAPFTDNVHFSPMMSNQSEAWGAVMLPYDPNRKFLHLLAKVAAITTVRSIGRVLMYDVLIPNQNR